MILLKSNEFSMLNLECQESFLLNFGEKLGERNYGKCIVSIFKIFGFCIALLYIINEFGTIRKKTYPVSAKMSFEILN